MGQVICLHIIHSKVDASASVIYQRIAHHSIFASVATLQLRIDLLYNA
jgi:hypothetical protein